MFPIDGWPDFSRRSRRDELMEGADLSTDLLVETFDAIERVNRWAGGRRTSVAGLEQFVGPETRSVSVLDVGTGNGAIAREFVEWGREHDVSVEVVGIDILPAAIRRARSRHGDCPGLRFAHTNLFDLDASSRFDIVHASLVLHHFAGSEALRALDKMAEVSRHGVVVNDLHRHPVHWLGSRLLVPMITDNPLAIHDGPVSVLRGFRRRELIELAGRSVLPSATVEWRFPFRWLLLGRCLDSKRPRE